jgi:hypothetical protein
MHKDPALNRCFAAPRAEGVALVFSLVAKTTTIKG